MRATARTTVTELERYLFDVNGFLVLPAVLSRAEVATLNAVLDAHGVAAGDGDITAQRFWGYLGWDESFRRLLGHPRVMDVLHAFVAARVRLDHHYGIVMRNGQEGGQLHGGATPHDPSMGYEVRDGRIHGGLTVVSWNLVDSRPGEGGFCCIPGSHKSNFPLPPGIDYGEDWRHLVREVPLRAGDVVVFNEALTHGTLPWLSAVERRAILFKYVPAFMAFAPVAPADGQPADVSDAERELLRPPQWTE